MTTFTVSLTVANPETGTSATVDAVVGTGVLRTVLPAALARQLGLEQRGTAQAQLPGSGSAELPYVAALLTVQGHSRTARAFVSPARPVGGDKAGVTATVGVATLRGMELEIGSTGDRLLEEDTSLLWEGAYADVGIYMRIR